MMNKQFGAVLAALLLGALPVLAVDIQFTGMARTSFAVTTDSGDFILAEQALHTALDGYGEKSAFHVSPAAAVSVDGEARFSIREAYIDLYAEFADIRVGKQAVVWGRAEGFFITDIVSPQNLEYFILADFSEIRIGIPAVRVQKYLGSVSFDVVWIPFSVPTIFPDADSPWYTPAMSMMTPHDVHMEGLSDGEVFGKVAYFGSGFDAELMAGYARDDQPVLDGTLPSPDTRYERLTVLGGSLSVPFGAVVARSEAAVYLDRAFTARPSAAEFAVIRKNELVALAGLDWSMAGIDFSVQYVGQYIFGHADMMVQSEYRQTASFRIRDSLMSDYLTLELFAYVGIDPFDALLRPSASWTVEDGVILKAGADIFLGDSSGQYGQYRDNTLVHASLSWYF
ncbi:MAG TPA: hypothetical protein PLS27_09870 [Treponemataceae bacterium]|nr:hypothetical protein [Treponemataceae bacterium]